MLIEHGVDVTAQTNDGWTPLHLAIQGRQQKRRIGWKERRFLGRFGGQKLEIVNMLINRGADVSALTKDG
jgi:hypothetical protein